LGHAHTSNFNPELSPSSAAESRCTQKAHKKSQAACWKGKQSHERLCGGIGVKAVIVHPEQTLFHEIHTDEVLRLPVTDMGRADSGGACLQSMAHVFIHTTHSFSRRPT
jgi:hypothetical protein